MKKSILLFLGLTLLVSCNQSITEQKGNQVEDVWSTQSKIIVEKEGVTFRDLNKNQQLDIYEDVRQPIEARIEDVLSQMNLAEKAGMMFIHGAPVSEDGLPDGKVGLTGIAARLPLVTENIN